MPTCARAYSSQFPVPGIVYNGAHRTCRFLTLFIPMSHLSPRRSIQSVVELTLMIVLIAIVVLSILLIMGDDIRIFVKDVLSTWFPEQS